MGRGGPRTNADSFLSAVLRVCPRPINMTPIIRVENLVKRYKQAGAASRASRIDAVCRELNAFSAGQP